MQKCKSAKVQNEDSILSLIADPVRANEFADKVDAIGAKYLALVGKKDVADIRLKSGISKAIMFAGRGLIHVGAVSGSLPIAGLGAALFGLSQFVEMETVAHSVLHGTYDRIAPRSSRLTSSRYHAPSTFSERGWMQMHNTHHAHSGVAGNDPDLGFGLLRNNSSVPWTKGLLVSFVVLSLLSPFYTFFFTLYSTGAFARLWERRTGQRTATEMTPAIVSENLWEFARKSAFLLAQNLVFFPLLTGYGFWMAACCYVMSYIIASLVKIVTTIVNHNGLQSRIFSEDKVSSHRAFWMAAQIESSSNIKVGFFGRYFLSTLAFQIEHHLFPRMPGPKLAAVAVEIQSLCLEYGIRYHRGALPRLVLEAVWRNAYFAMPPVMSEWIGERFPRLKPTG